MYRITPNIQNRAIAGLFYRKHDEPLEKMRELSNCILLFNRIDFAYKDEVNFGCGRVLSSYKMDTDISKTFLQKRIDEKLVYRFNMPGGYPALSEIVPPNEEAENFFFDMHEIDKIYHLNGRLYVDKNETIETYVYTRVNSIVKERVTA